MAKTKFSWGNYFVRLGAALGMVFATYNPTGHSYLHWAYRSLSKSESMTTEWWAILGFCGIVLVIVWTIFLRATYRSLGIAGTFLAIAFFGGIIALLIAFDLLPKDSDTIMEYLILLAAAGVMSVGISWSHIRRRVTGQLDVDEADV